MKTALFLSLFGLFGNTLGPTTPVRQMAIARPATQVVSAASPTPVTATRVAVPSGTRLETTRVTVRPGVTRVAVPAGTTATTQPATPSGTGSLTCQVSENGAAAEATYRVLDGSRVVASGRCLEPATRLPAGDYTAEVRLSGTVYPVVQTQRVSVRDGRVATLAASFQTARLTVTALHDGQRIPGRATLKKDGRVVGTLGSGVYATVEAGTYELVVTPEPGYEGVYGTRTFDLSLGAGQVRAVNVSL